MNKTESRAQLLQISTLCDCMNTLQGSDASCNGRDSRLFRRWYMMDWLQEESAPLVGKMLICVDLCSTSWQADRQMALLGSNLSKLLTPPLILLLGVCVCVCVSAKHSSVHIQYCTGVCTCAHMTNLYSRSQRPEHIPLVLIKDTAVAIKITPSFMQFPTSRESTI